MCKKWKNLIVTCSLALCYAIPGSGYCRWPAPGDVPGINYPPIGAHVAVLPKHHHTGHHGGRIFHYYGGIWYSAAGAGFTIVTPPIGIFVPVLPPGYATIWVNGIPYYYANNVYYLWNQKRNCYVVTEQPQKQLDIATTHIGGQLYMYPKNSQDQQQQADDRYDCHTWAAEQTHYDPTRPEPNVTTQALRNKRADYLRAMKACLRGKGYGVS